MATEDSNSSIQDSSQQWLGLAFTPPQSINGVPTGRQHVVGPFGTADEALVFAKEKCDEINGIGFTAESVGGGR